MTELRAFVTLAEQLHFGRAADRLHITQPALTKQIQRLEEAVGGALVLRGYREVQLTPAGEMLLPRATRLLQESAAALDAAAGPCGGNWACCGSASASRRFSCSRTSCCGSVRRYLASSSGCATWPRRHKSRRWCAATSMWAL